ncbi:AraC family transcriptional regulator [Bacteroides sp.]|uniref:AraC family transcriptional regulator n=1 Tax=Bacteroides sp. TaxID=29523 RepID=UPI00262E2270|nr:AraC family transcriptional regulator [Bacteroides sp.]MDD3038340.1 AraC family transcriptional regulator [Bacteroides sp.]
MKITESRNIKYFNISNTDEAWGIVVTTVGYQSIPSNSSYPPSQHPKSHLFDPKNGRILKEYQLIYISDGKGWFESKSCKRQRVKSGTMILLFPNEWHTYEPDKETGWFEYWVGFRGEHIDKRVNKGFFSPKNPVFYLGFSSSIIRLYEDIANYALQEKSAYQQIISSIVLYILGTVYYKHRNETLNDSFAINKINEARDIMKQDAGYNYSPESIADSLGVSYSWFRKKFKQYVDVSPAQYQSNMKLLRSKELLDIMSMSITDIAYKLGFENVSQFSKFFRKKTGIPPLQYRKEGQHFKK